MVEMELPTKFGLDPCSGFRETRVYGGTTDACAVTVAMLTKSSRAKTGKPAGCIVKGVEICDFGVLVE